MTAPVARFPRTHRAALFGLWVAVLIGVGLDGVRVIAGERFTRASENFVVTAHSALAAAAVAEAAEECRERLAQEWLGRKLPRWPRRCPISVNEQAERASGWTSYVIAWDEPRDWEMHARGPLDEILTVVLPHEVCHTVLVTHLGRRVPRWADEGLATLAECPAEQRRQRLLAAEVLQGGNAPDLRDVLTRAEYPDDPRRLREFYAVGFSLTEYLTGRKGKAEYVRFLETAHRGGWDAALHRHYDLPDVAHLQEDWSRWANSPNVELSAAR